MICVALMIATTDLKQWRLHWHSSAYALCKGSVETVV